MEALLLSATGGTAILLLDAHFAAKPLIFSCYFSVKFFDDKCTKKCLFYYIVVDATPLVDKKQPLQSKNRCILFLPVF